MNLNQFGAWALDKKEVGNPNENETYKGECVSLIQQYLYQVFNIAYAPRGNAKDWANVKLDGFEHVGNKVVLEKGDILVYGADYGYGYGHVAIIDINNKFLDQNGVKSRKVAYQDKPFVGYIDVIRPADKSKLGLTTNPKKSINEIAQECVAGKYGNGETRKNNVEAMGYNYAEVQAEVNRIMTPLKPINEVAKEVIRGDYGNGADRKAKLEAEGYNYNEVQAEVNKLI